MLANPIITRLRREGIDGLKKRMPRSTRFGLMILAALLLIGGGYSAYWFLVARRIEAGIIDWAQSQRADKIDVSWQRMRVSGYPAAFRVDLGSAALRDGAITPSPELHVPVLSGTARPWDFADWRLAAPEGFTADFAAAGGGTPAKLIAQTADGVVSIGPEGGWTLWLTLGETTVEVGAPVLVGSAHATLTVPPRPSHGHADPAMALAVEASQIKLPAAIAPFGDTIDELDFAADGKGYHPERQAGRCGSCLARCRRQGRARQSAPEMGRPRCDCDRDDRPRPGAPTGRRLLRSDQGIRPDSDGARTKRANASQRCRPRAHRADLSRQGRTGRQTGDQDRIHDPERRDVPRSGKARQAAPDRLGIAAASRLRPAWPR